MTINLSMPVEAVQLLLVALNELPMKVGRTLHDSIEAEAKRQIAEANKPVKKHRKAE